MVKNKIKDIMKTGALVNDEIITELLKNRLVQSDCNSKLSVV